MEFINSKQPNIQQYNNTIDSVYDKSILNMNVYNGRINLLEQPPTELKFALLERISIKNKATEYRNPIANIWEDTTLSKVFFCLENIQILQNGLRAGVYNMSNGKFSIPPQNIDQLKIIMRSIFTQYATFHKDVPVKTQISILNDKVLDYIVPYLYNEAIAYIKYCEDQSTLVVPLEHPKQTDRDFKQLEFTKWF